MSAFVGSEEVLLSETLEFLMESPGDRKKYFEKIMKRQGIVRTQARRLYIEYLLSVKRSDAYLTRQQDIEILEQMLVEILKQNNKK